MKKTLYCSPEKKLCGVCAGIADYFNIDPTLIRLAVVLIALVTAVIPALIVYFIVALIIPKAPDNYYQLFNNTSRRLTKGHDKKIAGVCSGFAEWFDIDPTVVRILFVVFVLLFGTGLAFYLACVVVMPACDDFQSQQYYADGAPYADPNQPPYGNPDVPPYQQNPNGQQPDNGNPNHM